jgi:PPOX class probable FMN-dependent enzyme
MDAAPLPCNFITSEEALRSLYPGPVDLVKRKQLDRLDKHCRNFIAHSPLVFLSTAGPDGRCDVTPRGDAPGFVRVLDDRHIALPDRKGNNRVDSMRNIIANPHAGLLFLVPGVDDSLRVNGAARIATDPWLLDAMAVDGRPPAVAIVVAVEAAFLHCGRAFKRSKAWDPARHAPKGAIPPLAVMLADQTRPDDAENAMLGKSETEPLY